MPPKPRDGILKIVPYVGGRSSLNDQQKVIRLASNEAAIGPSPKAIVAFKEQYNMLHRYPDGSAEDLRNRLSELHRVNKNQIVCGSGSDEILQLLARAYAGPGDEILYSKHGFLVYKLAALAVGATPVAAPEENYCTSVDRLLENITKRTKIIFLANPNNPTGSYVTRSELFRLWEALPKNILLVIDAAYAEFVTKIDYSAGIELVDKAENVVMTRTFSKIYGLAALRLGWCYGSDRIIDVLNRIRGPFNLTGAALAAGLAGLEDQEHLSRALKHNNKWMDQLVVGLEQIGIATLPSVCNFVLLQFSNKGPHTSNLADKFLTSRGILTRNVTNYELPDCLRVTIGRETEMHALLLALTEFMDTK